MDELKTLQESVKRVGVPAVSGSTGLKRAWLYKFANGEIPKPGYDKIARLKQHFSSEAGE